MKRIITCSDGTWNKPNSKDSSGHSVQTNVQKIFDRILKRDVANDVLQIRYYDEGVGAEGSWFTRVINGATGEGIDDNIIDAYKFIIWNYEPGDEIYLFGFSRGAYTARSLAGLIRKCGIIKKNNLNLIRDAYALYRKKEVRPEFPEALQFRQTNSYDISHIKFIGVWDTVGSRGIPLRWFQWYNRMKYEFYDTKLSSIIENAYHALAVDERRSNFKPTLWERSDNKTPRDFTQVLEQRWFAGVHSNVGGGYADEVLSNIALSWIMSKAATTGLAFDQGMSVPPAATPGILYNSLTGIYKWLPKFLRPIDLSLTLVDDSVYHRIRIDPKYRPKNIPDRS